LKGHKKQKKSGTKKGGKKKHRNNLTKDTENNEGRSQPAVPKKKPRKNLHRGGAKKKIREMVKMQGVAKGRRLGRRGKTARQVARGKKKGK